MFARGFLRANAVRPHSYSHQRYLDGSAYKRERKMLLNKILNAFGDDTVSGGVRVDTVVAEIFAKVVFVQEAAAHVYEFRARILGDLADYAGKALVPPIDARDVAQEF